MMLWQVMRVGSKCGTGWLYPLCGTGSGKRVRCGTYYVLCCAVLCCAHNTMWFDKVREVWSGQVCVQAGWVHVPHGWSPVWLFLAADEDHRPQTTDHRSQTTDHCLVIHVPRK